MRAWVLPAAAAMLPPATAHAQSARAEATVIMNQNPRAREFQAAVGYADAIVSGDTIYISGVPAGPGPGETSLIPGFERAFARIAATLKRVGASWDDVVDITTFHTDLRGQIPEFAAVKNRFVKAPFPVWTAIGVSALYEPTAVVEIKVIAKKRTR